MSKVTVPLTPRFGSNHTQLHIVAIVTAAAAAAATTASSMSRARIRNAKSNVDDVRSEKRGARYSYIWRNVMPRWWPQDRFRRRDRRRRRWPTPPT